ncbi:MULTISPECIES: DUF5829 family protein [Streptomyces]|uniref:Uncharacterized protein n=1 Tax=Streptomyces koelreuteriae TaxID=2838015 RepID=A0ABX8G3U5_9ACTN|nr:MULTISPECIES: DUF5829 family protein [Streptomyces]QWB28219.1 hypothetical protein KJK29_12650 [Streptomyces koelreuteriae]UUA11303.1 DUF5829 family protein [Streptomyces koelreuteriae]UUA18903.1 DUF5829 family protein [Streptomyces sp. CRCS-T-1]
MIMVVTLALAGAVQGGAVSARATDSGRQLLFYNHAYGVLDRETADAIEHSAYLRDFADFQVRTTTGSGGQTWTGRYLMGRETYLELFGVGDLPGKEAALGATGMGVSTERKGDLVTVLARLREQGVGDPIEFQQTRDFGDGVPVPWFDAVFTTDQYDRFGAWGMEYRPEYFADPRGNTEPAAHPGDVGRERYLPDAYRDRLMRDVTGIRLAVTARDLANTVPLLQAGGFAVRSLPDGGVVAKGGTTTLRFDAVPLDQVGLRQVRMSLNRPVSYRHEERIGHSTLTVGPGSRAVWTFDDQDRPASR